MLHFAEQMQIRRSALLKARGWSRDAGDCVRESRMVFAAAELTEYQPSRHAVIAIDWCTSSYLITLFIVVRMCTVGDEFAAVETEKHVKAELLLIS